MRRIGAKKKADQVERLLRNYREVFGLREYSKFIVIKIYRVSRKILLEIGEDLAEQDRLEEPNDVFFVRFTDILSDKKLKETVKENKEAYQRYMNLKAPRILTSTGESIYTALEESEGALTGVPVSAGVYEGRVKVLERPQEGSRLEKGDILVTRSTNPAWTPLFINLGAIIMETGGPISHGAVVAREYGIPAVVGVGEAAFRLKDGQIVRVNGEAGTIEIITEPVSSHHE